MFAPDEAGKVQESRAYLRKALEAGFKDRKLLMEDKEFPAATYHAGVSGSWIERAPVSYFVQGLRRENFRLRRGSTKQATNAVILDSRSSNPSPERSDGPTGSITALPLKMLFEDGQPGRCRLGNGRQQLESYPPASGGAGRGGVTDIKRKCLSGSRRGLPCLCFKTPTMVGPVPENAESRKDRSSR
jgi:hypothetical protein